MAGMNIIAATPDTPDRIAFDAEERVSVRRQIIELEEYLLTLPQVDIPIKHHFADGLYLREGFIPAGTLATGMLHVAEHANIISHGTIRIVTEDGAETLTAPATFICRPGVKKVAVAVTDVVMINVHANPDNLRDPDEIEERLFVRDHRDLPESLRAIMRT